MALSMTEIMEISFNILYLCVIWALTVMMLIKRKKVAEAGRPIAYRIMIGFGLLALGDTGHVGFRVVAFARGGLEQNATLVGLGALSTAVTVGILYMIIADMWRVEFGKKRSHVFYILILIGLARLNIMIFPQNLWGNVVPPFDWSLYRNIPLTIQGLGVAVVMLIDANKTGNKAFRNFAICIFVSYGFYIPVILFVQVVPMIGMLMIPKTLAYVAMAIIGYRTYFR